MDDRWSRRDSLGHARPRVRAIRRTDAWIRTLGEPTEERQDDETAIPGDLQRGNTESNFGRRPGHRECDRRRSDGPESRHRDAHADHLSALQDRARGVAIEQVPGAYNAFAYIVDGEGLFGAENDRAGDGQMVLFAQDGDQVRIQNPAQEKATLEILLIAGVALNEPISRYGPFVMNTQAEIRQAIEDYRLGRMGAMEFERLKMEDSKWRD